MVIVASSFQKTVDSPLHVDDVVHEEAVALVRGLAAGGGVGLVQEALVLEQVVQHNSREREAAAAEYA